MKDTRIYGKIKRNEHFIWKDFLIESVLWGGSFGVIGYFLPDLFTGYFQCVWLNILIGVSAGVIDAFLRVRWDFPYFQNMAVSGLLFTLFLYITMFCKMS